MPSNLTDYGQDYFLNALFNKTAGLKTSWYMALCMSAPDPSSDGTMLSEPIANGYARVQFNNDGTFWGTSQGGVVANIASITFAAATADWPAPITYFAFCDAISTGNVYLYGSVPVPRLIQSGHQVVFPAGYLTLSIQGFQQSIVSS